MPDPRVFLLPPGDDLLQQAAQKIIGDAADQLPDLSSLIVLLPSLAPAARLRRCLASAAGRGLLLPHITTLPLFAHSRAPGFSPRSALECRLLLTAAIAHHRNLFPGVRDTQAANALYGLFEELIAHGADFGADEAGFAGRLQKAYAAPAQPWLSFEAQIGHRLFRAYLEDTDQRSPAAVYRRQLPAALATLDRGERVRLLGHDQFTPVEISAVRELLQNGTAELWLQGRTTGHDGVSTALLCGQLAIEPHSASVKADERSLLLDQSFASGLVATPIPATKECGLELIRASGPEHEARCVDLAVRQALLSGARSVVVIAGDRRLARRLRALLERAGVRLRDPGGWALSTSSAAACLDAWLDCLASGFQFRPLLTLLKSSFAHTDADSVRALEQDWIYQKKISGGLDSFERAARAHSGIGELMLRLQKAARQMPGWESTTAADRWCDSLLQTLETLGIAPRLHQDEAGLRVMQLLEQLRASLREHRLLLDGDGFRRLLDSVLERETFVADRESSPVSLLTLEQSQNLRCDLLIVAGATREGLAGAAPAEPLFNNSVRRELGLPQWPQTQSLTLARLRRVLQSAPRVVITYAPESAGEEAVLSPWIEAITTSARSPLHEFTLAELAGSAAVEISTDDDAVPAPTEAPAPPAPADLIPIEFSATAHQMLMDCPYRFLAGALLRLRAPEAPDEDPDRSDYGKRVHQILQAFNDAQPQMPPPFAEAVTADNRGAALLRLQEIAQAVFAPDLRSQALAPLWLAEFHASLPGLLDWLQQRPSFKSMVSEVELESALGTRRLYGRADRLETHADGSKTLVDYKSGRVPKEQEVVSGEAVQLAHYAALDARIVRAEYLALKESETHVQVDAELAGLRDAVRARLHYSIGQLEQAAPLPAHGDETTCEHCDYRGLCRKGDWREPVGS